MTREEAIEIVKSAFSAWESEFRVPNDDWSEEHEALDMAIEALREPQTIIGIDIPYGNDKGIATIFKRKDDKVVLEEVKEIMAVVRCKDCKWYGHLGCAIRIVDDSDKPNDNDYCSFGERSEE